MLNFGAPYRPRSLSSAMMGLVAFFALLYFGRDVLMPVFIALLLSFSISPIVKWLQSIRIGKKYPFSKGISILLAIIFVILVLAILVFLVGMQLSSFASDLPTLTQKLNNMLANMQEMITRRLGIEADQQMQMLRDSLNQSVSTGTALVGATLNTATGILSYFLLLPVLIFFMSYYAPIFQRFLVDLSEDEQKPITEHITNSVSNVIQTYISSLIIVIFIVAVLNSVGMLLLGVKYAIFFGALISVLAIIPYFGILFGASIAVLYTLITSDTLFKPIAVIILNVIVQFLEGNFITPRVMELKLKLNPLMILIFLLIGGAVWGAVGMILAVPTLAITKMVCDNVESLRAYGRVLGTGGLD